VKGGTVVCAGIHMSDIPSFPYESLWNERSIRSVANSPAPTAKHSSNASHRCASKRSEPPTHSIAREGRLVGTAVLTM